MRKGIPIALIFLVLAGGGTFFSLQSQRQTAPHTISQSQQAVGYAAHTLTHTQQFTGKAVTNPYIYYTLKQATGFVLARAPRGSTGQPLGQPVVVARFSDGFGQVESDSVSALQLSPDGLELAINGARDHGEQVWMFNTQQMTMSLTPTYVMGNFLRWMPGLTGHTFLYRPMFPRGPQAPLDGNKGWDPGLWLIDAATGAFENFDIHMPSAFLIDAAPSPDGSRILYSTTPGQGLGSDTWMMNSDGSGIKHLFSLTGGAQSIVGLFAWSPDGTSIAYERLADSPTPFLSAGLWLMDANAQQQRYVGNTDGGHGYAPVWSPDSRKLAFVVRTNENSRLADQDAQALQSAVAVADMTTNRYWTVASPRETGMPLNLNPVWLPNSESITLVSSNAVNRVIGTTPRYWSALVMPTGPSLTPLTTSLPSVFAIE